MGALWFGGGGSRADLLGQALVRAVSWIMLAVVALFLARPRIDDARPIWLFLAASALLAAIQLVPLPPGIWQALPGREMLAEAAAASGQAQPWRPWSIVPGATVNALGSLIVPLTALTLIAGMNALERAWLPAILLGFIASATVVGLLQFSGAALNNPLINDTPSEVGGVFANRNHFALLLAIGCALAPPWAFLDSRRLQWRAPVAVGLVGLFVLTILATGSRAGIVLGAIGVAAGSLIVARPARRALRGALHRAPRWAFPVIVAAGIGLPIALVLSSVFAGRAASIDRVLAIDVGQDMRNRGLQTVLDMVGKYFPAGSGFGGFDPLFRIDEPFALLKPTYFNHAHNDWLEIALDGGAPAVLLLIAAVTWWGWTSVRAWKNGALLPRLGSTILLLVMGASVFDYPARTPTMMVVVVLAGLWLGQANAGPPDAPALPGKDRSL